MSSWLDVRDRAERLDVLHKPMNILIRGQKARVEERRTARIASRFGPRAAPAEEPGALAQAQAEAKVARAEADAAAARQAADDAAARLAEAEARA